MDISVYPCFGAEPSPARAFVRRGRRVFPPRRRGRAARFSTATGLGPAVRCGRSDPRGATGPGRAGPAP
eukprot:11225169-Lingulodinium_polyedra.AAC.1